MRWVWGTLLLLLACTEPEQVNWPSPDPEAPHQLLLRRSPDGELQLTIFEPADPFTWALADDDAWLLLRFDAELNRVLLDREAPQISLGNVALPTPKKLWTYGRDEGLRAVEQLPDWASGLGVTPTCPELVGHRVALDSELLTIFSGAPGSAYAAYLGGVVEIKAGQAEPRVWPQPVHVTAGVYSGGRLWVGLIDGSLAELDPMSGEVVRATPTTSGQAVRGLAAAPNGTVVAVDGAMVTWWSQGGAPFVPGPPLDLSLAGDRCHQRSVLLSWWPERSVFLATVRGPVLPSPSSRALWTASPTEVKAERLSPDLGAITGLFADDRGEPVLLGQVTTLEPLNPQTRAVIRFDSDLGQWRAERTLGVAFYDALAARSFSFGFVYVGLEGLSAAFRDYGGTCSPEPVVGEGDHNWIAPLDEHLSVAGSCGQREVSVIEWQE